MATRPNNKTEEQDSSKSTPEEATHQQDGGTQAKVHSAAVTAAARLSTSRPLGAPRVDTEMATDADTKTKVGSKRPTAGIMALNYVPTFGVSKYATSALNRAAFSEFNKIRCKISGNRPYEPADHYIYRACVDSLREMYAKAKRIYRTIGNYVPTNLYRPEHILAVQGLDPDNWFNNAAALYQWLHNVQFSLRPFPTVPLGKISKRREIWNSYYFKDGETDCSQTYILNQVVFYSYEKVDQVKGIKAEAFPRTFEEFTALWDRMYSALQQSSDVYIIAADIRRAFEDTVVTDLDISGIDDPAEYLKMDEVLLSIMNASMVDVYREFRPNNVASYTSFGVKDVNGLLTVEPRLTNAQMKSWSRIDVPVYLSHVNTPMAEPDTDQVLRAVRFKPSFESYYRSINDGAEWQVDSIIKSCGTEVVLNITTATIPESGNGLGIDHFTSAGMCSPGYFPNDIVAPFDWHPPMVNMRMDAEDGMQSIYQFEDIQNYIPISRDVLEQIHEAVLLEEFGVV